MELDVTAQFVPIFWGMVAVLFVLFAALLASIDPENTDVHRDSRPALRESRNTGADGGDATGRPGGNRPLLGARRRGTVA